MNTNVASIEASKPNPDELPGSPLRQRDPEPDRITRPDILPLPNSSPGQPSIPQTAPATSPRP